MYDVSIRAKSSPRHCLGPPLNGCDDVHLVSSPFIIIPLKGCRAVVNFSQHHGTHEICPSDFVHLSSLPPFGPKIVCILAVQVLLSRVDILGDYNELSLPD